jgi:hypothetical protein
LHALKQIDRSVQRSFVLEAVKHEVLARAFATGCETLRRERPRRERPRSG